MEVRRLGVRASFGCYIVGAYGAELNLFIGLKRVFDSGEGEGWEEWKNKALERWKDDSLLQVLLNSKT